MTSESALRPMPTTVASQQRGLRPRRHSQVLRPLRDFASHTLAKWRLPRRIGENMALEDVNESTQGALLASMLVQGLHN
jgi:hypothetical protein